MDYADYQHLLFDRRANGVVLITINRPEVMNATNARLHWELTQVWLTIDADPAARVALVTGAGRAFSAGGDISLVEEMTTNREAVARTLREAADLVYNMINLDKPVVSAINGVAVGAGLVVALLADISIMSEIARITDGHTKLGVAAGSQQAIRWTKRSLNNWLRQAGPIFDQSLALEMLTFMDEDVREGLQAIREKRAPSFPSAR